MVVCWSVKGGSGTSVVTALLSLAVAKRSTGAALVDLEGDQPAILGVDIDTPLGVRQWLQAGPGVSGEALSRLGVPVADGLTLLPSGPPAPTPSVPDPRNAQRLLTAFGTGTVVVDAGVARHPKDLTAELARAAEASLLVIRPCYLAVRRAAAMSIRATGVVLVEEPGRALDGSDVSDVLNVPVVATLPWDAALARAVDAGRLTGRLPRAAKAIDVLAASLIAGTERRAS